MANRDNDKPIVVEDLKAAFDAIRKTYVAPPTLMEIFCSEEEAEFLIKTAKLKKREILAEQQRRNLRKWTRR